MAEKDIWKVATQITKESKKRELDPMMKLMDQLSKVEGDKKDKEVKAFVDAVNGMKEFIKGDFEKEIRLLYLLFLDYNFGKMWSSLENLECLAYRRAYADTVCLPV